MTQTINPKIIALASDHAGYALKQELCDFLQERGFSVLDLGPSSDASVDYPAYGYRLAEAVASGAASFGVAICGSGIGISIAANRHPAIRCALCSDDVSAALSRQHNDANVLALGARLVGIETAKGCVIRFLSTEYEGGRHQRRVDQLSNPPA